MHKKLMAGLICCFYGLQNLGLAAADDFYELPPLPAPEIVTPIYKGNYFPTEAERSLIKLIDRVESLALLGAARYGLQLDRTDRAVNEAKKEFQTFSKLIQGEQYSQAGAKKRDIEQNLWQNYPLIPQANPEIRAIWLDRGTLVALRSPGQMAQLFDSLAASGINVIFVETINAGYPIYPSKVAFESNPQTQNWDRLGEAIKLGHARGMEVHAWLWTFAIAHQRHNLIMGQPQDYLGPVLSRHPEWGMVDLTGNYFRSASQKAFLDPGNVEATGYLLDLIREVVTNYDIDGLQLDYIRYPFQNLGAKPIYGYGFQSRADFWAQTQVDPRGLAVDDERWQDWTQFRTEQITSFVGQASGLIRKIKPQATISAAVFPYPRWERIARIQQDWEQWIEEGYVDWIVPMTYADRADQLADMVQPLLEKEGQAQQALILPAVKLEGSPSWHIVDQIEMLRQLPFQGYALFATNGFTTDLQKILTQTQGNQSKVLPHREPLETAALRFKLLGQEWSFYWVSQNSSDLSMAMKTDWQESSDRLQTKLNDLARNPNLKSLLFTQIELTSFREQLEQDYLPDELYQKSMWLNQLQGIEQLLAIYGQNAERGYFK